jgi:hypothetical protein
MILYYAPSACSQACHIALIEAGMSYRLVKVGRDKQTDDGLDFDFGLAGKRCDEAPRAPEVDCSNACER